MQTNIIINFQQEGIHRWENCPHEDVAFLRDYHRHIFHFSVTMQVFHDDREVEIIRLKRDVMSVMRDYLVDANYHIVPNNWSCEQMASQLIEYLKYCYGGDRYIKVVVLEDGENGGEVIYTPEEEK